MSAVLKVVAVALMVTTGARADPVGAAAGIAGDVEAVVFGDLGHPVELQCLAYGSPTPDVYWYRGLHGSMIPFSSSMYEARRNSLLIRVLTQESAGEYACQAYNGVGMPATWAVTVHIRTLGRESELPPLIDHTTTTTTTSSTPAPVNEWDESSFTVPVRTALSTTSLSIMEGSELSLQCDVDGYPEPSVYWTKDDAQIAPSPRVWVTKSRLTIQRAAIEDSGNYGCHAFNDYTSHSSAAQVTVAHMEIPEKCTDNPFFANCRLIVQNNFCEHKYYSKFCCKSCVQAGQLNPQLLDMQSDQPWYRKK